jgi:hypothetical protein
MEAAFELEMRPDQLDVQFDDVEDVPCTAEVADCTCPDFCERDHANE